MGDPPSGEQIPLFYMLGESRASCQLIGGEVQEPEEQNAPVIHQPEGSAATGEVTAVDEMTMKEEDLQEAVGL